ncbi:MAG: FHA domain-containing protein [Gammaproteobacteria bacterium]|nr:FHA domain-containing protein [Gammaproteobacteria bacterium]MDH3413233.1 FHA domain-containing protein [Gammaproteobacteria bacterium]
MIEEEGLHLKTVIAAPGQARRPASAPKARLSCSDGETLNGKDGAEILLDGGEVTIGRGDENLFVLKADGVSRRHARIFPHDHFWLIEDFGSTNGIKVNGETVNKVMLKNGDVIEIGPVPYTFNIDAQSEVESEKTTMQFAKGIPGFDPNRQPGISASSDGSNPLLWSIIVIGVSALAFAVFSIVSV